MKKIILKPHVFFFALIPILILLGFLYKNDAIDINIYNSSFVIEYSNLSYLFAVFFGLIGLNYFSLHWAKKTPKKWLTVIHIILQVVALLFFFTKDKWNWVGTSNLPEGINPNMIDNSNEILLISILFFIIATFFHLINFFSSLVSKSK